MLLLYLDGHGTLFDGGIGPSDRIKKRPKLPKGYRYLDERPKEETPRSEERQVSKEKESVKPTKPVSLADVERLAKIFQGDLYPENLYRLIDILEVGLAPSAEELLQAQLEAELYQKIAEAEREKELLLQIHSWILGKIKGIAWTDEEILTVLLLAKKN